MLHHHCQAGSTLARCYIHTIRDLASHSSNKISFYKVGTPLRRRLPEPAYSSPGTVFASSSGRRIGVRGGASEPLHAGAVPATDASTVNAATDVGASYSLVRRKGSPQYISMSPSRAIRIRARRVQLTRSSCPLLTEKIGHALSICHSYHRGHGMAMIPGSRGAWCLP